mgnify:CR=1 FL=1
MALSLITTQDILDAAGDGASVDITASGGWLTRIGEEAEGIVCSETRRNWVSGVATIDANVKREVAVAVASKAAIKVVKYDRTGYFSRDDQQTILDVLDNDYNKAIKFLSELDANSIRTIAE